MGQQAVIVIELDTIFLCFSETSPMLGKKVSKEYVKFDQAGQSKNKEMKSTERVMQLNQIFKSFFRHVEEMSVDKVKIACDSGSAYLQD